MANDKMMAQISGKDGFIAALDQSGGSTPGALRLYGIPDSAYSGDAEMFKLMHEMRVRIISAPAFTGAKVSCEFAYAVKQQVTLDQFRYVLCIGAPHSRYRLGNSPVLGAQGHRCTVHKNDFQATWQETEVVSSDPTYRTNYGRIHYLQFLRRDHPLVMRPGNVYRLAVEFDPDITLVEA